MTGRSRVAVCAGVATLAASSSLAAVYSDYGWVLPVAAAIAIVVGVGELLRRLPLPGARAALLRGSPLLALLAPLLSVAGVLCLLTHLYAPDQACLGTAPPPSPLPALG